MSTPVPVTGQRFRYGKEVSTPWHTPYSETRRTERKNSYLWDGMNVRSTLFPLVLCHTNQTTWTSSEVANLLPTHFLPLGSGRSVRTDLISKTFGLCPTLHEHRMGRSSLWYGELTSDLPFSWDIRTDIDGFHVEGSTASRPLRSFTVTESDKSPLKFTKGKGYTEILLSLKFGKEGGGVVKSGRY